jgi:prolyl 4-hydroxylase
MKKVRVKTSKAEVYRIDNFLSLEECDIIIKRIDEKNKRSTVSGGKFKNKGGVSNFRTSSTASMHSKSFPIIEEIDKRISRSINVPLELGEVTQGQKYEVGQEFKDHTDFFGKASLKGHGDKWGNRTWTFMIYLNDDLEGGETDFKKLGLKFIPKKGTAVVWRNMDENGKTNPNTLHAGRPVKKGVKYIITKWFREYPTLVYPISKRFEKRYPELLTKLHLAAKKVKNVEPKVLKNYTVDQSNVDYKGKTFSGHGDFPRFTEKGFKLVKVPEDTWGVILNTYDLLKSKIKPEKFKGQLNVIHDKNKKESPVDILSLSHVKHIKALLHKQLQPVLEEWSGQKIEPSMIYGIRSYKSGAILEDHKDRPKTHHISAIIIVDEDSNKPWPLDIQSHDGEWHKVYAKPGDMILYESCACQHGRLEEFDGNYFRNFFVHYQLKDWTYVPKQQKATATTA